MGWVSQCWQHPCTGRGWSWLEKSPPTSQLLQHLAVDKMGTSLDKPRCAFLTAPSLLVRELRCDPGDTEKELVPLRCVDGSKDQAGGSRLSLIAEEGIRSLSPH